MVISMNEINGMLKENMQRQLQEIGDLPEDLAIGYKNWVQDKIRQATQQLAMESQSAQAQAQQVNQPAA